MCAARNSTTFVNTFRLIYSVTRIGIKGKQGFKPA
jgi:hypothetical protein